MKEDFFQQLALAANDDERERLLLRAAWQRFDHGLRNAIRAAAVPHWFDAKSLATLLNTDASNADKSFQEIATLPYVETHRERGLALRERTRRLILEDLWRDDCALYQELSRRAAKDCAGRGLDDPAWRIELIYHLLIAQPDLGIGLMHDDAWRYRNPPSFQYARVEALARSAREHVSAGRLTGAGAGWTCFWEAMVDFDYSRYPAAKEKLLQMPSDGAGDRRLAVERATLLADVNLVLGEREAARQAYTEALALYRSIGDRLGEVNSLLGLGSTYGSRDEWQLAQQYYQAALALQLDNKRVTAGCLASLGDVRRLSGDIVEAERLYREALAVYRDGGFRLAEAACVQRLGYIHEARHEWQAALAAFQQAMATFRAIGSRVAEANCFYSLGVFHRTIDEQAASLECFRQSRMIYHEIGASRRVAKCDVQISLLAARD